MLGVKNFSVGICDGAPSTARSSLNLKTCTSCLTVPAKGAYSFFSRLNFIPNYNMNEACLNIENSHQGPVGQ